MRWTLGQSKINRTKEAGAQQVDRRKRMDMCDNASTPSSDFGIGYTTSQLWIPIPQDTSGTSGQKLACAMDGDVRWGGKAEECHCVGWYITNEASLKNSWKSRVHRRDHLPQNGVEIGSGTRNQTLFQGTFSLQNIIDCEAGPEILPFNLTWGCFWQPA